MGQPTLNQTHYRFQDDTANCNTAASLLGTEDITASANLDYDTTYFIRVKVSNTGAKTAVVGYRLQHQVNGGGYLDVTAASSTVPVVNGGDTDGDAATELLTNDGGTYTNGEYDESGATGAITLPAGPNETEVVYAVQFLSSGLSELDKIEFRLIEDGTTNPLDNYNITPTVIMGAAPAVPGTSSATPAFGVSQLTVGQTGADVDFVFFIQPASPWYGAVNAEGFAATVEVVQGVGEKNITGALGEVNVEGFASDVDLIRTIDGPEKGTINVEGFAATASVIFEPTIAGALGEVNVEGFAATAESIYEPTVFGQLGETNLEGFAATVEVVYQPTVFGQVGEVNVQGFAATVETVYEPTFFSLLGEINLEGFAATITSGNEVIAQSQLGQAHLEGFAATAQITRTVTTLLGEINLEGFESTVQAGGAISVTAQLGVVNADGSISTVTIERTARPDNGEIQLEGFAATVAAQGETTVTSVLGEINLVGFSATVTLLGRPEVSAEQDRGGGSGGRFYDEMDARMRREDEEILMFIQQWLRDVA